MTQRNRSASALISDARLAHLARRLTARQAVAIEAQAGEIRAAVALVVRPHENGPELLLIQRAAREGDPWSGHVAFPGGRYDARDASLEETAIRETLEETAIDIALDGAILGALDDIRPMSARLPAIVIRPFVAVIGPVSAIELSAEVAEAFWVPVSFLADPTASGDATVVFSNGEEHSVSSFRVGQRVVWGLTERILRTFIGEFVDGSP